MQRRAFLATPGLAAFAATTTTELPVVGTGDGIPHRPEEYAALLARLSPGVKADNFSLGGVVETLEQKVAALLGKEYAVWMPTGTLANHTAVRALAGDKRRVVVQKESHLYNDCGDCCQTLSNLNLLALGEGKATFTLADIQNEAKRGDGGRVAVPIGAIQIETPVRRQTGEVFDFEEIKRISAWARANGVGMHLDGARLFLASAYSGKPVSEYASHFDTVFVSMYKYFNAASGAVLAGPKKLLENMFHTRRMFGGGQPHAWPFAAVALHYFEGYPERMSKAVETSEKVIAALRNDRRFEVERVPNGTNIFFLRANGLKPRAGLMLGQPSNGRYQVQVNETWARASADEIISRFG